MAKCKIELRIFTCPSDKTLVLKEYPIFEIMERGIDKYFLAIIPPDPIHEEALQLKNHFKEKYNSKGSLNSPPHITLHMPFQWKKKKEKKLIEKTNLFVKTQKSFTITLKDFGCFMPRVIFIDTEKNDQLNTLQRELQNFYRTEFILLNSLYRNLPFHPHLTLAFRDLKKPAFAEAWKEFQQKEYEASFIINAITLLKHNGRVWERFHEFLLPDNG